MEEKLKLKNEIDDNFELGRLKFEEAVQNKQVKEWVHKYLTFLDGNAQENLIKCYENLYYNNESKNKEI